MAKEETPRTRLVKYHSRREGDRFYAYDVAFGSPFEDDDGQEEKVRELANKDKVWRDEHREDESEMSKERLVAYHEMMQENAPYQVRGPGFYCVNCDGIYLEWDTAHGASIAKQEGQNVSMGASCFDCAEKIKFGIQIERKAR